LVFDGSTSSLAHEFTLSQLAEEAFGTHSATLKFRPLVIPPDSWQQITIALINAVAVTRTASVAAEGKSVEIYGITDDGAAWSNRLASLRAAIPSDVALHAEVVVIPQSPPLADLCVRTFSRSDNGKIGFKQSSAEIRTPSYATLDAIINLAYDCQGMTIAITGHSDSSGNEVFNQRLSLARAQSVAGYLARGGLAADRLLVTGAGSLFPVAENSNALGRRLNRRIEIQMLPTRRRAAL
jgi:outer membrane protein OmpA-like peptidoglycan-associated protein